MPKSLNFLKVEINQYFFQKTKKKKKSYIHEWNLWDQKKLQGILKSKTPLQCFGKLSLTAPGIGNLDYSYGESKKEGNNKTNNLLTNTKILLVSFPESGLYELTHITKILKCIP